MPLPQADIFDNEDKPVMSQEDAQKITSMMQSATKNGIGVTAIMRDMLVLYGNLDFKRADDISQIFDARIQEVDFLFTLNGTTFDRGFVPTRTEKGN